MSVREAVQKSSNNSSKKTSNLITTYPKEEFPTPPL